MIFGNTRLTTRLLAFGLFAAGLTVPLWAQTTPPVPAAPAITPPATMPAATRPTFPPITAIINGEVLTRDDFQIALELVSAPRVFEEELQLFVVRQACQAAGITVGPDQVKAQREKLYASFRAQGVPENQLEQALITVIQRQGLTYPEFEALVLPRMTYLAIMSKGHGDVTDAQVDDRFKEETGIRYALVDTRIEPSQAAQLRKLIETDKKSIQEAGQQMGFPQQAFQMSEFATSKEYPQSMIDQAKKLKKGELSPMLPLGDNNMHMLYLQDIIPAAQVKPAEVADYKAKLKARLIDGLETEWGANHLRELIQRAQLDIQDPLLYQFVQQMAAARAAQAAAATQAASRPATAPAPK